MKFFVFIALALIGCAAAAQLPDSATQGPNPQDIATPEPEYIDVDEPLPAAPAPAPRPVLPAPRPVLSVARPVLPLARPIARPVQQPIIQRVQYVAPFVQQQPQQVLGHAYSSQGGYQYRRPVYVRRFYRLRRY